jgi:hypothetical protein
MSKLAGNLRNSQDELLRENKTREQEWHFSRFIGSSSLLMTGSDNPRLFLEAARLSMSKLAF